METMHELLSTQTAIDKARLAKATKISTRVLGDAVSQAITVLDGLSDEEWQDLALESGVNAKTTPSAESRRIVRDLLRGAKL